MGRIQKIEGKKWQEIQKNTKKKLWKNSKLYIKMEIGNKITGKQ